ncbi:MAG: PQQ-binding-like beta-propeller repeat protein, partial [Planctomycetes bacterium]|nr:PQQ-binding-like beta-propeller repeat protein [Planctomycetota bacterium]
MRRLLLFVLAGMLSVGLEGRAAAQFRSGLIPPPLAQRYGLERKWFAQVELDSATSRVTDITQHVSRSFGLTVIDIVLVENEDQKIATLTDRDLDAFGKPLGTEGVKKEAAARIEELAAQGVEAKSITTVVPEITLYVVTDSGLLHAIDGETGATRWAIPVGNPHHPTFAPAANDYFVAAVNGVNLFVFDALDGRLVWRKRMQHAVGAGPAVSQQFVHVPMVTGLMESHYLADPAAPVRVYQSFGRAILQPAVSPNSLIWATDRGFVYVSNADRPGVRFRLETQDEITGKPAWLPPDRVVAVSHDGDVYAVDEFTGNLVWRFSTGDPIGHAPVAVGNDLYAITNNFILFRLSSLAGGAGPDAMWSTP